MNDKRLPPTGMATPSDTIFPEARDTLLQHLNSVYALAQAVTPHAEAATTLTTQTFQQAFDLLATEPTARPATVSDKQWLFQLLMEVRRTTPPDDSTPPIPLYALRHQLAEEFVERTFPRVFATLPGGLRVLLLLCEVEGLSCTEAGQVLGMEPEEACERLKQAKTAAEASLRSEATMRERHLLNSSLHGDWLTHALRHTVTHDLTTLAPTLFPSLLDAAAQTSPESEPQEVASPSSRHERRSRVVQYSFVVLLLLSAGFLAYIAASLLQRNPETNLIVLSAQEADRINPMLSTTNPGQAEEFIREQLQWRLTLPSIEQATLLGVGILDITEGVSVPVFLYQDNQTQEPITLYTYTYALLQRHPDRLQLAPDIRRQIETDHHFDLHDLGEAKVLVWRNQDDIFVAVIPTDAASLRERIIFPS